MSRRLSRKGFLSMASAAALSLAIAQACSLASDKPAGRRARRPWRAACCQGPRPLTEAPTPPPAATSTPEVEATPTPFPVASSIQRPPQPTARPQPTPFPLPPPPSLVEEEGGGKEEELAQGALALFGAVIVLQGQEWGDSQSVRQANIEAAIAALARLPQGVVAAISDQHPHGPLHILCNNHGRTLAGWQPYGDFPIGFYTNSDHDPSTGAAQASNQVVLIPGFANASIGHELLHAYQFRAVPPDRYGLAMLGQEMRSFSAAVGWVQLGSDDAVREASQPDSAWAEFNALFEYRGRELSYLTASGTTYSLRPVNPLEALAVAGSFYYTRPASVPLPEWPEYWSWFAVNLG